MALLLRAATIAALFCTCLVAGQNGIRLAGSSQPDCWSVEEIVRETTRGMRSDREKALALHRFGMQHFIHFDGPKEERDEYITDPLKLIAVYGYALCHNNSSAMIALYNAAGLKGRQRDMRGHSIAEVWFEGKWNYIDTDMFGYVLHPDGRIASVDELTRDPDLFLRQTNPPDPFFPFDRKEDMASVFREGKPTRDYHPYANAHLMHLSLRTGETARLFFRPRGEGRYFLTPDFRPNLGFTYKDYWLAGAVREGSLAWCDRPPASYGNGVIQYAPDLRSDAFTRENPDRSGVAAGQGPRQPELVARRSGQTASLVVKVTTPWIIAGLQNDLTNFEDNTGGAIVSGLFWRAEESDENRILVSRDRGQTWQQVWENRYRGAVPFRVDLTRWAEGEYGYWVKFEWLDRSGKAQVGLERLRMETWVQVSPMALPRLEAGSTTFRLAASPLDAVYNQSRWDRGQNLPGQQLENAVIRNGLPYLQAADPARPAVVSFETGTDREIRELRVSLRARAPRSPQDFRAVLSISGDSGATWRELERFTPHPEHNVNYMWFNHVLSGRAIDGRRCRLKVEVSGGGLDQVIANSVVAAPSPSPSPLRVTHVWREGERQRTFSRTATPGAEPYTYTVEAAPGLVNEEVRIEAIAK